MPSALRSTAKRIAQKVLGQDNVRDFIRTRRLWLDKKIYRRSIEVAELRQRLIDLGVTRGRTVWVQSSWNEFYNVPMKPSEVVDLLRDLIGPEGTLAMPAFPIDHDASKVFMVDRAPVYTGLLCEVFRRVPGVQRSIHLTSSVSAVGPNADFLIRDHHRTMMTWGKESPFCRLMEVDARMLGLGATFNFMTPLHAVECASACATPCPRWPCPNCRTIPPNGFRCSRPPDISSRRAFRAKIACAPACTRPTRSAPRSSSESAITTTICARST
jgi:aminoglycoside 3-N-acetyltransferase